MRGGLCLFPRPRLERSQPDGCVVERDGALRLDLRAVESHASLAARDQMGSQGRPVSCAGGQALGRRLVCLRRQDRVSFPHSMTDHCRKQATDPMLGISGSDGCVQELAPPFKGLNGSMLWKLTGALRFPSPKVMQVTCMAHRSRVQGVSKSRSRMEAGASVGTRMAAQRFPRTCSPADMATGKRRAEGGGGRQPRGVRRPRVRAMVPLLDHASACHPAKQPHARLRKSPSICLLLLRSPRSIPRPRAV